MQLNPNTLLQLGKYRINRVLGQGGFGITYLAENLLLDKKVAIKEFFPKEYCDRDSTSRLTLGTQNNAETVAKLKDRFLKEARNIAKLDHPGIIRIHDVFEENNTAYYVMDYIDGESLNEIVRREGPMIEERAVKYIRQVGEALEYIHSRNMTHFDVKPANIMLRRSDDVPVLIDFGLSKQYDNKGDATSTIMNAVSPGYSPIEMYNLHGTKSFSPKIDIYSLGATMYFLINATIPPYASEVLNGAFVMYKSCSVNVCNAIKYAMSPIAIHRPASVREFISAFYLDEKIDVNLIDDISNENTGLLQNQLVNISGYEAVDLGLSVLWATKDIGASDVLKRGDSYLWGDPDGSKTHKVRNSILSRWFCSGPKPNNISGNFQFDTATHMWGEGWKMPTIKEVRELFDRCICVAHDNINIMLEGPSGASIVIDNRWHWTAESPRGTMKAFNWFVDGEKIYLNFSNFVGKSWSDIYFPIRPVAKKFT